MQSRAGVVVAFPPKRDSDPLRQGESELLLAAARLCGVRRRIAAPKRRTMWSLLSGFGFPSTRASVVVPVFPEEPAHGRQDREWDHDRSEDDERRRLIAGCGNNIRGSPHEIILHRCVPPAFIFSFSNGRFRSGARR